MAKVTVTKEVAAAIEHLRTLEHYQSDHNLIIGHAETFTRGNRWAGDGTSVLNGIPMDTFASAVTNGYEVEQTPEDKVKTLFIAYGDKYEDYDCGVRKGAEVVLEIYGIKVEGVND